MTEPRYPKTNILKSGKKSKTANDGYTVYDAEAKNSNVMMMMKKIIRL